MKAGCPECQRPAPSDAPDWSVQVCQGCHLTFRVRPQTVVDQIVRRSANAQNTLPDPIVAPRVCVIEDVRSEFNIGSMFRSADGLGWQHLCLVGISGHPPSKEIAKTALGAETFVDWSHHLSSAQLLDDLIARGYSCVALEECEGAIAIDQFSPSGPLALIVGNEVWGVSPEALRRSSRIVKLPTRGKKNSLNAAVAFGIAAYALTTR